MPQRYGPENHDDKSPDGDRPVSRWIEAIDACRPGSDDLAQGELVDFAAELDRNPILAREFRRVQQLDTALVEAVADVPLPEGLQERLLAGLRAASADAAPAGAPSVQAPVTAAVVPISQGASNSRSGRYLGGWITVGGVAALAASVALMVYLRPAPTEIGVDEILQLALDDHQRILSAASAPTALPVVDNTGDKEFPLSNAVVWHRAKLRDVQRLSGAKGRRLRNDLTGRRTGVAVCCRAGRTARHAYRGRLAARRSAGIAIAEYRRENRRGLAGKRSALRLGRRGRGGGFRAVHQARGAGRSPRKSPPCLVCRQSRRDR